jgi:hypothetical protein
MLAKLRSRFPQSRALIDHEIVERNELLVTPIAFAMHPTRLLRMPMQVELTPDID